MVMSAEAAAYHATDHLAQPDAYRPNLRALIETGALVPAAMYLQAQRLREELRRQALAMLDGLDCLVMPSVVGTAPAGLAWTGSRTFQSPWSLFGMPSLSIPGGLSREGLPYGVQLIGAVDGDYGVLNTGDWCEHVLGDFPAPRLN